MGTEASDSDRCATHAQAAVFVKAHQPLELHQFPMPSTRDGAVVIEIDCCTLCGSDLHTIAGRRSNADPTVLGHEAIGRVYALPECSTLFGSNQIPLKVGDRVTWSIVASCGECLFCERGLTQKCQQLVKFGHESVRSNRPLSGGLATHCSLPPGTTIVPLPDNLPDTVACPANCAASTVLAAFRTVGNCEGRRVLIIGGGMLGLTAAAVARHKLAQFVAVSEPDPSRRLWARRFGADLSFETPIPSSTEDFDVAIDMSGSPEAIEQAFELLRIGGRLLLVGTVFPTRAISLAPEQIVRRMIRIEGLHNYEACDLVAAVDFLTATWREFPFEELVGAEFPLSDVNQAILAAQTGSSIRIAVRP